MRQDISNALFILLAFLFIGTITLFCKFDLEKALVMLGGFSTFVAVLITAVYVFVTNRQLGIMQKQLQEMKTTRELSRQPILLSQVKGVYFTDLQLRGNPKTNQYDIFPVLVVDFFITNIGADPALTIDIFSTINAISGKLPAKIDEISNRIECLVGGKETETCNIRFPDLFRESILDQLVGKSRINDPTLDILVLYTNLTGGCFKTRSSYQLFPEHQLALEQQCQILNDHRKLLKDNLNRMNSKDCEGIEKSLLAQQIEDQVKQALSSIRKDQLRLYCAPDSQLTKTESISLEEYNQIIKQFRNHPKQ